MEYAISRRRRPDQGSFHAAASSGRVALKHGVAPRITGGDILIRAERTADATRIEVENSGQLREGNAAEPGVGLNNTRERLRILYGGRATLELRNRDGGRVVATVLIPAQA